MNRGETLFLQACGAADTAAWVRELEPGAWQDLYAYLRRSHSLKGVSGALLGLLLVEGAARYARLGPAEELEEGGKIL